jgi:hypothetical protein
MRTFLKPIAALLTIGVVTLAFVVGLAARPTRAADHLDAAGLTSPGGDGRLDITDVYAFQSPANSKNTVLIMAVNPAAGGISPTTFHPKATYEFLIDENGDAKPDTEIEIDFGKVKNGKQEVELELEGPSVEAEAEGKTGRNIEIKVEADDNDNGDDDDGLSVGTLRADLFDDPFFFDLNAFLQVVTGPRTFCDGAQFNFFEGLNVSAIVVELPSDLLGPSNIGVWARTVLDGKQIDRMGRPAINTVFIPNNPFEPVSTEPSQKDAFNAAKPNKDQAKFRGEVVDTLEIFYAMGDPTIDALADILLPDILTVDTSDPTGFLNGRRLADDVIDAELALVTNGAVTTDCVDNDSAFTDTFPYLAPAN